MSLTTFTILQTIATTSITRTQLSPPVLNGLFESQVGHYDADALSYVLFSVVMCLHQFFLKAFSQFTIKASESFTRDV